jgi:F0F1-type ATP synthase assembly protein I
MEPEPPSDKEKSWLRAYARSGQYAGAGIQLAVSVFLCLLGGNWLDQRWGTSPLFLILGVFLGGGAGFYNLVRVLTSAERRRREEDEGCGKA